MRKAGFRFNDKNTADYQPGFVMQGVALIVWQLIFGVSYVLLYYAIMILL